jgi:hypothetical protein
LCAAPVRALAMRRHARYAHGGFVIRIHRVANILKKGG